jgi:hypothetical protein
MGSWSALVNGPSFNADTMLLLTDGTVMCHELLSPNWYRLTPDFTGSYSNGSWSTLAPMPNNPIIPASAGGPTNAPLYFASAMLRDGRVFVAGGEDNNGGATGEINATQIYDPVPDFWTIINAPSGLPQLGDAPSCVLADGRLIIGTSSAGSTAVDIFDPTTQTYTPTGPKGDSPSEETWTLLPNGNVLAVQCSNSPNAEQYNPTANLWIPAGSTISNLTQPCPGEVPEIGPALLLPNGTVFAIGASGATGIYTPNSNPLLAGTWAAGPNLTDAMGNPLFPMDAPAVLLPNGQVLLTASPAPPCSTPPPTTFFLYNPATNKVTIVGGPANSSTPCYAGRMLLLPNGQVLFSNGTNYIGVYTPNPGPLASWQPVITSFPAVMAGDHTYNISGKQFNGLSQACSYGDDAQMATNYPIAQLTSSATSPPTVAYLRTFNFSSLGVAVPGTVSTDVWVPCGLLPGPWSLVIIANGIASNPVTVQIKAGAAVANPFNLGLSPIFPPAAWAHNDTTSGNGTGADDVGDSLQIGKENSINVTWGNSPSDASNSTTVENYAEQNAAFIGCRRSIRAK